MQENLSKKRYRIPINHIAYTTSTGESGYTGSNKTLVLWLIFCEEFLEINAICITVV